MSRKLTVIRGFHTVVLVLSLTLSSIPISVSRTVGFFLFVGIKSLNYGSTDFAIKCKSCLDVSMDLILSITWSLGNICCVDPGWRHCKYNSDGERMNTPSVVTLKMVIISQCFVGLQITNDGKWNVADGLTKYHPTLFWFPLFISRWFHIQNSFSTTVEHHRKTKAAFIGCGKLTLFGV